MKVDPQPFINLKPAYTYNCDGLKVAFNNTGSPAQQINWDFGDGQTSTELSPTHVFSDPAATYLIQVNASNGACTNKSSFQTQPYDVYMQLNIPNVLTPNNDKVNDCFEILPLTSAAADLLNCGKITIFDRWGKMVHQGELKNCWKAEVSGKDLPEGVYYYIIDTKVQKVKGFVTVVR